MVSDETRRKLHVLTGNTCRTRRSKAWDLVVGSVALDSVKTLLGGERGAGRLATYFSVAAAYFTDVALVAVVGSDFPVEHVEFLSHGG